LPGARATDRITTDAAPDVSLKAIVDRVAIPVWVTDGSGIVLFANPQAVAALGYDDASDLQGRNGHDTVHHTRRDGSPYPAEECPVLEPARTGETVRSEEDWFIRRDGTFFPVSFTAVPIDLPDGRGVVMTFVDMSAQREAEQALRERDAILARVAQPVWVVDHRGCFRYANPAALAALGYDEPSELVGKPGHATVHYKYPDGRPFPEEECQVARARHAGESLVEHHDWLVRKDGSILRIAYSTAPFELPDGLGSVTAFTDIEEQLQAERAARERDIAATRAAELSAARRRIIEAADAAREQVTRDLHDGAQQQFVSALLNLQVAERKDDEPAVAARLRTAAVQQTRQGIAELRDLAAGLHPAVLTDRGLAAAVHALATGLPLPVAVSVRLDDRLPPPLEASLYFFVSEALANVVKHARASHAHVRLAAERELLVVEVGDDGVGGATGDGDGGGSGLAGLADRIAALDGRLEIASPAGGGTTLRAEVPLR
jgi:PAS domain S-box-containing protein